VTRATPALLDFCTELVQVAVVSYAHRLLGLRTLEARIAKLEREVGDTIDRARRERRRAA
jgi:hypothetical protein